MQEAHANGPADLRDVVLAYSPDADEASYRKAVALLDHGDGWRRSAFAPGHFTASGFVVSPDRESLLLIEHARLGRWLQPGGHLEPADRTVEEASRREVFEETGIDGLERLGSGLVRIDAHPIPQRIDEPAHVHVDLGIAFVAPSSEIGPIDEVLDARWVPFDALDAHGIDDAVRAALRVIRRLV